jgi:hypothetical protein
MTSPIRLCPKCGAVIPADAPEGKLDPIWGLLRGGAAFQKLCEEKQP